MPARFALGKLVATPGALEAIQHSQQQINESEALELANLLVRHAQGDFGEMPSEDVITQLDALNAEAEDPENAQRMISAYTLANGTKIWVITEWDRSITTVLLPEEY